MRAFDTARPSRTTWMKREFGKMRARNSICINEPFKKWKTRPFERLNYVKLQCSGRLGPRWLNMFTKLSTFPVARRTQCPLACGQILVLMSRIKTKDFWQNFHRKSPFLFNVFESSGQKCPSHRVLHQLFFDSSFGEPIHLLILTICTGPKFKLNAYISSWIKNGSEKDVST